MSARAAGTIVVAGASVALVVLYWQRRRRCCKEASILVAACDLDKTVYPPAGPNQASQLAANVAAMAAFEGVGGFVFPVTGNNIPQAQIKFTDGAGARLRKLDCNPGIFCNGSLVLGPGGTELERHSPGKLRMTAKPSVDFVTSLIEFWLAPQQRELLDGVGLLFFLPDELVAVDTCAHDRIHTRAQTQDSPLLLAPCDRRSLLAPLPAVAAPCLPPPSR